MCLIVDANVAALVFARPPHNDFLPIWNALARNRARAVLGGRLTGEYLRLRQIRPFLLELNRRGSLRRVLDADVDAATDEFAGRALRSDDPHILGLAKVADVRLLCSHDRDLHADFTDPVLLRPAGCVYQCASHQHLIRRHCTPTAPRRLPRKKKRRP
jgi:predicted nucleic acid-binding protein